MTKLCVLGVHCGENWPEETELTKLTIRSVIDARREARGTIKHPRLTTEDTGSIGGVLRNKRPSSVFSVFSVLRTGQTKPNSRS
jgi:hypothetical protein